MYAEVSWPKKKKKSPNKILNKTKQNARCKQRALSPCSMIQTQYEGKSLSFLFEHVENWAMCELDFLTGFLIDDRLYYIHLMQGKEHKYFSCCQKVAATGLVHTILQSNTV